MELELPRRCRCRHTRGVTPMAGNSFVFTIARVAEMLGEDEEWLREISVSLDPDEGSLRVIGVGEDGCPAFTEYGIECLQQIIVDLRSTGQAPHKVTP